jgi:hypothetical protein
VNDLCIALAPEYAALNQAFEQASQVADVQGQADSLEGTAALYSRLANALDASQPPAAFAQLSASVELQLSDGARALAEGAGLLRQNINDPSLQQGSSEILNALNQLAQYGATRCLPN